jgi:hypothetical protein
MYGTASICIETMRDMACGWVNLMRLLWEGVLVVSRETGKCPRQMVSG